MVPLQPQSPGAAQALRDIGAGFLFLPPYSPDLNLIEISPAFTRTNGVHAYIFAKLKALIRKAAARTCEDLWQAVGHICDLFTEEECYNFFKGAGYRTD